MKKIGHLIWRMEESLMALPPMNSPKFLEYMLAHSKPTDYVADWLEDYYLAMTI